MAATESDITAKLIERLLADPAFRDRFRRSPAAACREAGLDDLADEMSIGAGKAMHTLDMRESRSSLAGVVMAAAMEGMGLYEFSRHVVPQIEDLSGSIGDVLSRVNMPALPGGGSLSSPPPPSAAPLPETDAAPAGNGGGGTAAAAPVAPAAAAAPPELAGEKPPPAAPEVAGKEAAGGAGAAGKGADGAADNGEADGAAGKGAADGADGAADKDAAKAGADGGGSQLPGGGLASGVADAPADAGRDAPAAGSALPAEAAEPKAATGGELPERRAEEKPAAPAPAAAPATAAAPPAAPEAAAAPAAAPAVPPVEPEKRAPVDADQFGQEGTGSGGKPDAEMRAILENKNVTFDSVGVADIKAGRIDPRIIGVLTKLSQDHKIVVSCMCSDHPRMTTSGFVSNHTYGRGLDIASIDGEIVSPGSAAAREVSSALSDFDPAIRPDEIGSPFAISGPGYFTDAAHQNHVHVGFKTEISPDWKPPPGLAADAPAAAPAAPGAPAAPAVAAAAPGAVAAPPPPDPERDSGLFSALAPPAEPGKVASAGSGSAGSDSGLFAALDANAAPPAQPAQVAAAPAAAAPPAEPAAPGAVDVSGAPDAYPGDDAGKEQLAAWMAKQAEKRGLPPQLPVMAALVESGLKNLNYGDADSVGFFQMRTSIWNQGDYAGYDKDPRKQVDWFLDTAESVKAQRKARGQSVTDPDQFGEWIADVERPAAQYRGRYQLQLEQANSLLKNAPPPAAPEAAAAPAAAPAVPPVEPEKRAPVDADQFGQEGTGSGGKPDAEMRAILENKNVTFDSVGVADIKAGRIDPRIIGVLTKLSQDHKIVVSCMCSDHPRMTTSGFVSNHTYGRGLDIASIDGEIVSPGSAAAREVSSALSDFDPAIRPDEIGSPFAISGPGYFTDAAHQNHVHVGFKTEISPDWKPPPGLAADAPAAAPAAPGAPAAPAVAAAAPGAVAAPPPPDPERDSGLFSALAPPAEPGKVASAGSGSAGSDSGLFAALDANAAPPAQPAQVAAAPAAAAPPAEPAAPGAVDVSGAPDAYPGDDAGKEQLAAWMAKQAEKRGLPPQLPVMAALVESGLKNLNYGDADSVGFFQMRTSIWNQGDYAGYDKDPRKQVDWFLDTAESVKAQRKARGQSVTDPDQFGEWIADVERPAAQYRGRYQLQLEQANSLLKNAPPPAAPEAAAAPAAAPAVPPVEPEKRAPVDADQFGQEGTGSGGKPDAEMRAILENKNVTFDSVGVADIKAGRIDPRIIGVLTKLSQDHKIVVSCMCSDHPRMTTSGFVSNHTYGRGLDIASIDGEIVSPGSAAAREVSSALSDFDPAIRPDEIGSPFAISGPGYFTDAAHQNHVHVGFKTEISPDWKPPPGLAADAPAAAPAAPGAPAAPAVAAAAPGAVAAPPPPDPERDSGLFSALAPPAEPGKVASAGSGSAGSDSGLFAALDANAAPPAQPAQVAAAPAAAAPPAEPAAPGAVDVSGAPDAYPGDDAGKEQLAAWMAKQAEKRGLPPQLPVMAALVESGLKNLNYGDADSVGFFQMRTSIWNQGDYAGYDKDPRKQVDWFLDTAESVKAQRKARGQSVTDPDQFGEWIADVERPAAQYRGRYQLQLDQANSLLKNAPPPAAPEAAAAPAVADAAVPPAMAQGPGQKAEAALVEAKKFLGTPYKWGGSTPQTGFDCSGLVQWAYAQQGVEIPRVTDQQILATNGDAVKRSELLAGDLVFFRDSTGYVHHVGMSLGGDKFIHAPHTGDVVKISSLDEAYYKEQFTGGRRFDKAASAAPAPAAPAVAAAPVPVVDPVAVANAQAAVARDAAEAGRQGSGLFKAISVQEARNHEAARALASDGSAPRRSDSALFLQAITPERAAEAKAAALAAPAPPPAPAAPVAEPAAAPGAPAAPEVAAQAPAGPAPQLADVPAGYPGDDAGQKALAKWLAKQAEKAGLPPELPVMASLVESGVKNLNFGDADSVGFFQMRTSIWNQGEYAGYPEKPGLQAKWFVDHALAHKKQQIARGDADFGKDPATWGEWIADVERPAEQYRGRYQLRLEEARRLLR